MPAKGRSSHPSMSSNLTQLSTLRLTNRQYEMQSYNFTLARWKEKATNPLVFFGIQLGRRDSAIMDIMAQWCKHQYAEHQGNVSPDKRMVESA
jgi:hypothetical protein